MPVKKQLLAPENRIGGATSGVQGVQAGNLIYVGGQMSLDESDDVKLYIYYHADSDAEKIATTKAVIDAVQREFYPTPGPAATSIRVAGFAFENLLIEIEAMAVCR